MKREWVLVGLVGSAVTGGIGFWSGQAHCQYGTPTVTLPTGGVSLGAGQPQEPPWVKRIEEKIDRQNEKVDRILKLAEDEVAEQKANAAGELSFRQLSADDSGAVRRKVSQNKMPPKGEPPLTPEEKTALLSAMEGKEADPKALSDAGGKCVKCHAPGSPPDAGGGFTMFEVKKGK